MRQRLVMLLTMIAVPAKDRSPTTETPGLALANNDTSKTASRHEGVVVLPGRFRKEPIFSAGYSPT
jgi:hypothetical protein